MSGDTPIPDDPADVDLPGDLPDGLGDSADVDLPGDLLDAGDLDSPGELGQLDDLGAVADLDASGDLDAVADLDASGDLDAVADLDASGDLGAPADLEAPGDVDPAGELGRLDETSEELSSEPPSSGALGSEPLSSEPLRSGKPGDPPIAGTIDRAGGFGSAGGLASGAGLGTGSLGSAGMSESDGGVDDLSYAVLGAPKIAKPSFPVFDLLSEALAGVLARPARLFLTALGTVLGIAALVATLGLARTAGAQIVGTFDELSATRITIEPADSLFGGGADVSTIPWDAGDRIERLNGVTAAGTKSAVDIDGALVRSVPIVDPIGTNEFAIDVVAGSPGLGDAVRADMWQGRWFDDGHEARTSNVAVLGPAAAARLNINRIDHQPAIFVGADSEEQAFVVIGIIEDVERETDLLSAIVIPNSTARAIYGLEAPAEVHVDVEVGAAELIGGTITEEGDTVVGQAIIALDPNDPTRLSAQTPPSLRSAQTAVEDDINGLFLILGGISLLVGALGIANVTLVSVLERTSEIGLRRALGAARRHIAAQFLVESTVTGLLGGLIGASLGTLTIVVASASRDWTPVLDQWLPFAATAAGAAIGLLSGTYPALRAARTEPISALRTE